MSQKGIPVTLITGYLGAGKTTLLNHLLANSKEEKYVVIENEYALEFGIENEILPKLEQTEADEGKGHALQEIFEFGNGCLCCSSSADFKAILSDLARKEKKYSRVLVDVLGGGGGGGGGGGVSELFTLSINQPEMLSGSELVDGKFYLEGIVTVVDAKHFLAEYQREVPEGIKNEAREQLVSASVIILNKIDLVSQQQTEKLKVLIGCLNEGAVLLCTRNSKANPEDIFVPFGGAVEFDPTVGGNFDMHDPDVTAECYVHDGCVDLEMLKDWLEAEQDLLRTKGVVFVEENGIVQKYILQGVRGVISVESARMEDNTEPLSKLAIIGRRLKKNHLQKRFDACCVGSKSGTRHLDEDVVDGLWRQLHALLGAMEMTVGDNARRIPGMSLSVLKQYARLRPGSSIEVIEELEQFIGTALPPCVKRSLLLHDGCDAGNPGVFYGSEWRILSTEDIKRVLGALRESGGEFTHISREQVVSLHGIRDVYCDPMWVPLMSNADESEFIGVDLNPAGTTKKGSIHHWGNRIYQRVAISASWEQFLEAMVGEAQDCVDRAAEIQEKYRSYKTSDGGIEEDDDEEDIEMLDLGSRHEDTLLRRLGNKVIAAEKWKRMETKISRAVREGGLDRGSVFGDIDPLVMWNITQQIWDPDHFAYLYTAMLLMVEFYTRGCIEECPSAAVEIATSRLGESFSMSAFEGYGLAIEIVAEWIHKQGVFE